MNFSSAKPLVLDARERGYAVPAFNTNGGGYDLARAALEAAQELQSPLILQVYEPNCEYRGFEYFVNLAGFLCDELKISVPVALHLDHGKTVESACRAMQAGFTSIMFDASHYPLEENIAQTAEVIKRSAQFKVSIEAEVGYVKGNEPAAEKQIGQVAIPLKPSVAAAKTSIDEVLQFTKAVEVDMLAVSIGTTHGVYQEQSDIDFELLAELRKVTAIPLVMHGTGGISLDDHRKLAAAGMAKINFGEPFRYNYVRYFNQLTDEMEHLWHPWRIMQEAKNMLADDMKQLIEALGAVGKAR